MSKYYKVENRATGRGHTGFEVVAVCKHFLDKGVNCGERGRDIICPNLFIGRSCIAVLYNGVLIRGKTKDGLR